MSVPTHNLYDFVHQVLEKKYWLEYFYPWGTRHIRDIVSHQKEIDIPKADQLCRKVFPEYLCDRDTVREWQPMVLCHDQEPLNFDLHQIDVNHDHPSINKDTKIWYDLPDDYNLRYLCPVHAQKQWILLHSEINSEQLVKYENTGYFIGAYWWSHALISLDWYRFAKYDQNINHTKSSTKTFLIYNRDQTGSRAYRKQFNNLLEKYDMIKHCQIGSFKDQIVSSDSSAIYQVDDFNQTDISVVLETVADNRIHLTEKTLRAIALAHPFFIMAGPGSLEYLKKYGFKTFSPWLDESYDTEKNQQLRMQKIIDSMRKFCLLDPKTKIHYLNEMQKIAKYNRELFFSDQFFNTVVNELKNNVATAQTITEDKINWESIWNTICYRKRNNLSLGNKKYKKFVLPLIRHLKKGGTLDDYVPPDLD